MRAVNRRLIQLDFLAPLPVDLNAHDDVIVHAVIQIISDKAMAFAVMIKAWTIRLHRRVDLFQRHCFAQRSDDRIAEADALTVVYDDRMGSVVFNGRIEQCFALVDHLDRAEHTVLVFADAQLPHAILKFRPGGDHAVVERMQAWPQR